MKHISLLLITLLLGCSSNKKQEAEPESGSPSIDALALPETAEINLDTIKWQTVKLKGQHIIPEEGLMTSYGCMAKKGEYLIVTNGEYVFSDQPLYLVYEIPSFKLIRRFGKIGGGPGELGRLAGIAIDHETPDLIGHIYDDSSGEYFKVTTNFEITRVKQYKDLIYNILDADFDSDTSAYYLTTSMEKGRRLCRFKASEGFPGSTICDLSLNPAITYWYAYAGGYAINSDKNRIIYAYNFFRQIHLFDLNGNLLRILKGKGKNDHKTGNNMYDWMDNHQNANYYSPYGVNTTDQYIYFIYLDGITIDDSINNKNKKRTLIEQYDWNGNPIRRIELDRTTSGAYLIDEDKNKIYLLTNEEDDPLYVYDLPKP